MTFSPDDIARFEAKWAGEAQEKLDAVGARAKAAGVAFRGTALSAPVEL